MLQNYALWQFGPVARKIPEPFTGHFTLFYLDYPWYRLVIARPVGGDHRRPLAVPQIRHLRDLDPRHHPGPGDGAGHGHSGALGADRRLRDRRRHGGASGVLFGPLVGVNHAMGLDWILKAFIVVVVGGMGNLGGSIAAAIMISLLEAYASLWVSPAQAVIVSFIVLILTLLFRPTGLFVADPEMTRALGAPSIGRVSPSIVALLIVGAARVARVLAALPDRDPDLGPAWRCPPTF